MHLKKKIKSTNLAYSLRPSVACGLDRKEQCHVQKMLFTSQTLGALLYNFLASDRKVFLRIKLI